MMDIKKLGDEIVQVVREYVGQQLVGISKQLAELTSRLDRLPAPKDGKDGRDGENGKDADSFEIKAMVDAAVALIPVPSDGKSVTVGDVAPLIAEEVGKAVAAIPAPKEEIELMVADLVAKAVEALPKAKDGESVPADQVQKMIDEAVSKAVAVIPLPKDGEHGRDAADIEILPSINQARRYSRGTYASHNGGLWRAMRSTEGMDGWECIVNGVSSMKLAQGENQKAYSLQVELSDGSQVGKSFFLPAMIYRGVFREGDDYTPGDTVTWGGSLWHCNEQTAEKPIDGSKSWTLAAKRGRDGKDGAPGQKGDPGLNGKDFRPGAYQ